VTVTYYNIESHITSVLTCIIKIILLCINNELFNFMFLHKNVLHKEMNNTFKKKLIKQSMK